MTPILECRSVSRIFPGREGAPVRALEDISLSVERGEYVCLLGRSGCGKSTLLSLLAGLDFPTRGEVLWNGAPIAGLSPARMLMFQEAALFSWLNVEENVMFGMESRGWPKAECRARARHWLEIVGLGAYGKFRVHELSGGMRQRAALAQALALEPEVLLMDEPFSALDAMTRERLYADMQHIWEHGGSTVVMVTHNVREAVCLGCGTDPQSLRSEADMSEFGDKLLKSMEEAVQIAQGTMPKSQYKKHVIQVARAPEHVDVKSIRERMGMTQASFAASFGLSLYTVRGWEQGKRKPDPAARAYLRVIEKAPDTVRAALAG